MSAKIAITLVHIYLRMVKTMNAMKSIQAHSDAGRILLT